MPNPGRASFLRGEGRLSVLAPTTADGAKSEKRFDPLASRKSRVGSKGRSVAVLGSLAFSANEEPEEAEIIPTSFSEPINFLSKQKDYVAEALHQRDTAYAFLSVPNATNDQILHFLRESTVQFGCKLDIPDDIPAQSHPVHSYAERKKRNRKKESVEEPTDGTELVGVRANVGEKVFAEKFELAQDAAGFYVRQGAVEQQQFRQELEHRKRKIVVDLAANSSLARRFIVLVQFYWFLFCSKVKRRILFPMKTRGKGHVQMGVRSSLTFCQFLCTLLLLIYDIDKWHKYILLSLQLCNSLSLFHQYKTNNEVNFFIRCISNSINSLNLLHAAACGRRYFFAFAESEDTHDYDFQKRRNRDPPYPGHLGEHTVICFSPDSFGEEMAYMFPFRFLHVMMAVCYFGFAFNLYGHWRRPAFGSLFQVIEINEEDDEEDDRSIITSELKKSAMIPNPKDFLVQKRSSSADKRTSLSTRNISIDKKVSGNYLFQRSPSNSKKVSKGVVEGTHKMEAPSGDSLGKTILRDTFNGNDESHVPSPHSEGNIIVKDNVNGDFKGSRSRLWLQRERSVQESIDIVATKFDVQDSDSSKILSWYQKQNDPRKNPQQSSKNIPVGYSLSTRFSARKSVKRDTELAKALQSFNLRSSQVEHTMFAKQRTVKGEHKVLVRGCYWLKGRMYLSLVAGFIHGVRFILKMTIIPAGSYSSRHPVEIMVNFIRGFILRPLQAYSFYTQYMDPV